MYRDEGQNKLWASNLCVYKYSPESKLSNHLSRSGCNEASDRVFFHRCHWFWNNWPLRSCNFSLDSANLSWVGWRLSNIKCFTSPHLALVILDFDSLLALGVKSCFTPLWQWFWDRHKRQGWRGVYLIPPWDSVQPEQLGPVGWWLSAAMGSHYTLSLWFPFYKQLQLARFVFSMVLQLYSHTPAGWELPRVHQPPLTSLGRGPDVQRGLFTTAIPVREEGHGQLASALSAGEGALGDGQRDPCTRLSLNPAPRSLAIWTRTHHPAITDSDCTLDPGAEMCCAGKGKAAVQCEEKEYFQQVVETLEN